MCLGGYDVIMACCKAWMSSVYKCSPLVHRRICIFVTNVLSSFVYDQSSGRLWIRVRIFRSVSVRLSTRRVMGVWRDSGVGRALGLVSGSGIVAGGGWDGCCGASRYFIVGCWVVDVLGMRVHACGKTSCV